MRKPLGLSFSAQEIAQEKDYIHVVGLEGGEVVASTMLVPDGIHCKMQRVVVKPALQSRGIGSQMMHFCEQEAARQGFKKLYCHARDSAVTFYRKNGYQSDGDFFLENTIPHLRMWKALS